jgi:hypothetical protein
MSKKNSPFVAVKHNGQVNGKDVAFCFHEQFFDAVISAKGKHCVLHIDPAEFVTVIDVRSVEGVEYRDGKPIPAEQVNLNGLAVTDDDIPF